MRKNYRSTVSSLGSQRFFRDTKTIREAAAREMLDSLRSRFEQSGSKQKKHTGILGEILGV